MLLTDTDTLIREIRTEDIYQDISRDKEMFDFRNYSAEPKYYDDSSKLVIGEKMKDERSGIAIKEFVGLKSEMHSLLADKSGDCKLSEWCKLKCYSNKKS